MKRWGSNRKLGELPLHCIDEELQSKPQKRGERERKKGILGGLVSLRKKNGDNKNPRAHQQQREGDWAGWGSALHSPSSPICWSRSFKDTLAAADADADTPASQSDPTAVDKILHLSPFSKARLIATPFRPGRGTPLEDVGNCQISRKGELWKAERELGSLDCVSWSSKVG